jgi:uncharacterized protein (DUF1697 family)
MNKKTTVSIRTLKQWKRIASKAQNAQASAERQAERYRELLARSGSVIADVQRTAGKVDRLEREHAEIQLQGEPEGSLRGIALARLAGRFSK